MNPAPPPPGLVWARPLAALPVGLSGSFEVEPATLIFPAPSSPRCARLVGVLWLKPRRNAASTRFC